MDKKRFIYILTGIMGLMILVIIIIAVISAIGGKKLSYNQIEERMEKAAQNYFKDNASFLPKEDGKSVTVDSSTLVNGGYLPQLSDMVKDKVDCSGKVVVSKNGASYLYSPILNCGDKYKTNRLLDVVTQNNPIVTSGDGLYAVGNVRKFKGEYIDNFVKIDGYLWRILDIDSEGYMRLIYADKTKEDTYVWDDRYNIEKQENVGINNYSISRIKEAIESLEAGNAYISEESKAKLAYRPICIGKRSADNLEMNINQECESIITDQLFGLPYTVDYVSASTDSNCQKIKDESCKNYNYLMNSSYSSWTLTGQIERSYRAFSVSRSGFSISNANSEKSLRPTIYLNVNVLYASGTGTQADPYIIK